MRLLEKPLQKIKQIAPEYNFSQESFQLSNKG